MSTNIKKLLSRFDRTDKNISRILETNFPIGSNTHLPFWEELHTVKNINASNKDNQGNKKIFELVDSNVVKGYVDADGARCIHFIGPKRKLIKTITASYYHAIADDIAEILVALKKYPDAELIIDVSEIRAGLGEPNWDFISFFLKCLDKRKVKYTLVELSKFDIIYINNFTLLAFPFHSGARLDILSDFFSKHVTTPKQKPYRKVYVSRGKMPWREPSRNAKNFSYHDDNRIDSHQKIEKLFVDLGFEIVYPEDFSTFQEQLDFFYSVKTIASLTSSGLVNAVFMQPGGTIVEISTPLITKSPIITKEYLMEKGINPEDYDLDINVVQEIHMFYHNLAFFKEHAYISIPNYFRDSDRIKSFIDANKPLKELLEK